MQDLQAALARLTELGKTKREQRGRIKTGFSELDTLLEGGLPRGYVTQIYGPPMCGKSAVAGCILSHVGENSPDLCALVDTDHSAASMQGFCRRWDALQDTIVVCEPRTAQEALEVSLKLVEAADLVVIDSLGAFSYDKQTEPAYVVEQLSKAAYASGSAILVTNPIRIDIKRKRETAYGGFWTRYHSSYVISLEAKKLLERGMRVGITVVAHLEKPAPLYATSACWEMRYV